MRSNSPAPFYPTAILRTDSSAMGRSASVRTILLLLLLSLRSALIGASVKYNQRTFINTKAINFVDPTKHGFRLMLRDEFLKEHMAPILLPTLYVSAIPLRRGEGAVNKVFYPDSVHEEKQVNIAELRENSWYYLCIEWENFNRHNETTGTDCGVYRTLDRFGKGTDSTISEVEATDVSSQMFMFRLRVVVDFPVRISASLEGGKVAAPPAQVFVIGGMSDLDVIFPFLRHQKDYGRLCILEEPLVNGYTAMGRLISGLSLKKCYFESLKTKDYELSISDSEASPYRRSGETSWRRLTTSSALFAVLSLLLMLRLL